MIQNQLFSSQEIWRKTLWTINVWPFCRFLLKQQTLVFLKSFLRDLLQHCIQKWMKIVRWQVVVQRKKRRSSTDGCPDHVKIEFNVDCSHFIQESSEVLYFKNQLSWWSEKCTSCINKQIRPRSCFWTTQFHQKSEKFKFLLIDFWINCWHLRSYLADILIAGLA